MCGRVCVQVERLQSWTVLLHSHGNGDERKLHSMRRDGWLLTVPRRIYVSARGLPSVVLHNRRLEPEPENPSRRTRATRDVSYTPTFSKLRPVCAFYVFETPPVAHKQQWHTHTHTHTLASTYLAQRCMCCDISFLGPMNVVPYCTHTHTHTHTHTQPHVC